MALCRYDVTNFIDERQQCSRSWTEGRLIEIRCRDVCHWNWCGIEDWLNRVVVVVVVVAVHVSFSASLLGCWARIACVILNQRNAIRILFNYVIISDDTFETPCFLGFPQVYLSLFIFFIATVCVWVGVGMCMWCIWWLTCYIWNSIAERVPIRCSCCEWTHERGSR